MTSTAEAKRVVQETIEQLGGIDIVVSNAVGVRGFSEAGSLLSGRVSE
jgi:NAD(P)-dependent dehydrogenase (short-subunit alcohol dehydrogenase family)